MCFRNKLVITNRNFPFRELKENMERGELVFAIAETGQYTVAMTGGDLVTLREANHKPKDKLRLYSLIVFETEKSLCAMIPVETLLPEFVS